MLQTSSLRHWIKGVLIFPLLSGLLMLLGWPPLGIFPAVFIGLIPVFFALDEIEKIRKGRYIAAFLSSFFAHILWIGYCMKWLGTTSPQSYLTGIVCESVSLSVAMIPAVWAGMRYGKMIRFLFFAAAWLAIEFLNQTWSFGTPYFALGSGFGMHPGIIQHYEFIGVEGGTVWLLLSNFLIYNVIVKAREKQKIVKPLSIALSVVLIPLLISWGLFMQESSGEKKKVSALHTYMVTDKPLFFHYPEKSADSLLHMSEPALKSKTNLLVWPEVAINNLGWLMNISRERAYVAIHRKLEKYPETTICTGGFGFSLLKEDGSGDPYSRYDSVNKYYYQTHNIALSISYGERSPIRSKKYFVPFQERIPFLKQMPFMQKFSDMVGSPLRISYYPFGVEIHETKTGIFYAPMLCYESVYPLIMAQKASESELISISANERWNKDLSGSKQYLYNNVAMAIQSRIPIVKSSNSGVSAIIDKKGNILGERLGREAGTITAEVELNDGATIYSLFSGVFYWTGVIATVVFWILILSAFFKRFFVKQN